MGGRPLFTSGGEDLALTMAASAPSYPDTALIALGMLNLWVFALDDHFDEGLFSDKEIPEKLQHYCGIAQNQVYPDPQDDLAVSLFEVIESLNQFPCFPEFRYLWADALCGTMDGMAKEKRWANALQKGWTRGLPSLHAYLEIGRFSVGGPPHIWAMILLAGDPSIQFCIPELEKMEKLASTCIRLANDLRSHEKEQVEGKINSLMISAREVINHGIASERAAVISKEKVKNLMASGLAELDLLVAKPLSQSGEPEKTIQNVARFVCDFYGKFDFHTFNQFLQRETRLITKDAC